jgi:hypothetical protein
MGGITIVDVARDTRHARTDEAAESQIETFISRRDRERRQEEGERQAQEMYAESVRRHEEGQRRLNAAAWYQYHQGQAERHRAVLQALIGHHEAQAEKYRGNGHYHEEKGSECLNRLEDSCSNRKPS